MYMLIGNDSKVYKMSGAGETYKVPKFEEAEQYLGDNIIVKVFLFIASICFGVALVGALISYAIYYFFCKNKHAQDTRWVNDLNNNRAKRIP